MDFFKKDLTPIETTISFNDVVLNVEPADTFDNDKYICNLYITFESYIPKKPLLIISKIEAKPKNISKFTLRDKPITLTLEHPVTSCCENFDLQPCIFFYKGPIFNSDKNDTFSCLEIVLHENRENEHIDCEFWISGNDYLSDLVVKEIFDKTKHRDNEIQIGLYETEFNIFENICYWRYFLPSNKFPMESYDVFVDEKSEGKNLLHIEQTKKNISEEKGVNIESLSCTDFVKNLEKTNDYPNTCITVAKNCKSFEEIRNRVLLLIHMLSASTSRNLVFSKTSQYLSNKVIHTFSKTGSNRNNFLYSSIIEVSPLYKKDPLIVLLTKSWVQIQQLEDIGFNLNSFFLWIVRMQNISNITNAFLSAILFFETLIHRWKTIVLLKDERSSDFKGELTNAAKNIIGDKSWVNEAKIMRENLIHQGEAPNGSDLYIKMLGIINNARRMFMSIINWDGEFRILSFSESQNSITQEKTQLQQSPIQYEDIVNLVEEHKNRRRT